jgi:hypothetical protein
MELEFGRAEFFAKWGRFQPEFIEELVVWNNGDARLADTGWVAKRKGAI